MRWEGAATISGIRGALGHELVHVVVVAVVKAVNYLKNYVEDYFKAKDASEVTPLQERLIEEEGISCTREEVARYE